MTMRVAAVQWVSGRQMIRHRLLPLAASNTVFPATSSLSLSLINHGPQLQLWAVPVTPFSKDDDVRLVALGNRDAASKCDVGARSLVSVSDTPASSRRYLARINCLLLPESQLTKKYTEVGHDGVECSPHRKENFF